MRVANEMSGTIERPVAESVQGGVEILEALAPPWRALCDEGRCTDPFYRPEWIAAHLRAFEPGAKLRVVVVREDGRPRLILPLVEERATLRGFPIRRLRAAAGVHSCRFDLICGAGDPGPWVDALWSHLRQTGGWDVIELRDVPAGGAAERLLEAATASRHPTGTWESMRTPYVTLPAGSDRTIEEVLRSRSAHFRANLRRRMRRLEERGSVRLRRIEHADRDALDRFYELEREGWKGARGTAIACDDRTLRFYDEVAAWAAQVGLLSLYSLEVGDRPIAMHYGLATGGRYLLPKPAFDPAWSACSPGQLILHEVLRDCLDRGFGELDFLGPWMEWKADWTDDVRPHAWCYVFRRGPLGAALHAAKFGIPRLAEALRGR